MERYYHFAGLDIAVQIPSDRMYTQERSLAPFSVDSVVNPHRYTFEVIQSLAPPSGRLVAQVPEFFVYDENGWRVRYIGGGGCNWESAYIRAAHRDHEHRVQVLASKFPDRIGMKTVLRAMAVETLIAHEGGFVFHCSCIQRNGSAVLFTAPSGVGKSTQADLWHSLRGAEIVNGDRAAVRVVNGTAIAEGIPFSGSSSHCRNLSLPLEAIVYLGQAPSTSLRRLRGYEAFRRVWEGCSINTWESEDMRLVSGTVQRIVETVPVFYLACTPDESAVIALEQALGV